MLGVWLLRFQRFGGGFCCRFCRRHYFAVLTVFWARMGMLSRDLGWRVGDLSAWSQHEPCIWLDVSSVSCPWVHGCLWLQRWLMSDLP
jgi:hypothetical protein